MDFCLFAYFSSESIFQFNLGLFVKGFQKAVERFLV